MVFVFNQRQGKGHD